MTKFNPIKQYGVELHEDTPTTSTPICKMIPSVIDVQYAHLFKASPDMYEALKALIAEMKDIPHITTSPAIRQGQQALAKADGKQCQN